MSRYDRWAEDPRYYPRRRPFGPNGGAERGAFPIRPPHWWGDPFDPRYVGFELPARYGRGDYDQGWRQRPEQWPEGQPSRYSNYGRRLNDEELRSIVRRRLFEDTSLQADSIQVDVRDAIVTLSGEVEDYLEVRYAWDDAWETDGVEGVVSKLTVRGSGGEDERRSAGEE